MRPEERREGSRFRAALTRFDTARSAARLIRPAVKRPAIRYYTDWGLYPDQPYVIGPPWSSVVAYDLNSGTIKWKVPLGQDAEAAAEGAHDTGAFMAEHHGMIVTSTGLIFIAASDGKLRALDEDTGKRPVDRHLACGLRRHSRHV